MAPDDRDVPRLFDLGGKVALVTGGAGHLGRAIARGLAEAGATVVVTSRDAERASSTAASLPAPSGARHAGAVLDHGDEASIARGFDDAVRLAGQVDVLVNNAHEAIADDWTTVSFDQFTRQLANASGYFALARRLRDHAVERGAPASVILLGSMYGLVASYPGAYEGVGPANPVAYQTLKGGIIQMARHLAIYWAPDRVRVNCLSPGPFPAESASRQLVERLETRSPMGRMGRPDELRGAVVFLASDASSYVTGHNLVVDGGWTAW